MRYALASDLHASTEALRAVLRRIDRERVDRLVCLGDHVGYNAEPDACVALLRPRVHAAVMGNHDRVAARLAEPEHFSRAARHAILWTREAISESTRGWLAALPITAVVDRRFLAFHAALHPTPNVDGRLDSPESVAATFDAFVAGDHGVRVGFFGHTHRALVYQRRGGEIREIAGPRVELADDAHYLVNPGSVGQPRDGDRRAAFAIFDSEARTVELLRVAYDAQATRAKTEDAGLIFRKGLVERGVDKVTHLVGRGLEAFQRRLPI